MNFAKTNSLTQWSQGMCAADNRLENRGGFPGIINLVAVNLGEFNSSLT